MNDFNVRIVIDEMEIYMQVHRIISTFKNRQ